MARIKYIGQGEVKIPGLGPVSANWQDCPEHLAREFEHEEGFQVSFDDAEIGPKAGDRKNKTAGGDTK